MRTQQEPKKKRGHTDKLSLLVLLEDVLVTGAVLLLCFYCVKLGYDGALPFLTALIGLQQAKSGFIITAIVNKNRAENTVGGIAFEKAVMNDGTGGI